MRRVRLLLPLFAAMVLLAFPADARTPELVTVRLLSINDLHGAIDTGRTVRGRSAGGAAYLAAHIKQLSKGHPNTLLVGAGDMVGGSPAISALLQDEPTVRSLNAMGMIANAPGNHEFDRGIAEMLRLSHGGCHPTTGCFEGARYEQISANIIVASTGQPLFAPYRIEYVHDIPIAFIGAISADTPNHVVAGAVDGLLFPEPAPIINRYVSQLQAQGVHAFVVLIHEGGFVDARTAGLVGPITATLDALDPDVDVVLTSHTHVGYLQTYGPQLVTQGFSEGTAIVSIDLGLDRTNQVVSRDAQIVTTFTDAIEPDPTVQAVVDDAQAKVGLLINRVVGVSNGTISRTVNRNGESEIGNLIADAFRTKTGAQIGLMNSGGMRENIAPGEITWGDLFAVQPFGNELYRVSLTGEQIYTLFNAQWTLESDGSERYRPNQVSGLTVIWDAQRPRTDRIVSLTLADGQPIRPDLRYSVAVNSFMAGAGEGYGVFAGAPRELFGTDLEAFVEEVERRPRPFDVRTELRIQRLN